ncbi:MAG: hypothetical protein LPH21_14805 [Shewanella sp.]|nr:hypothetical protein [Shewanella sp.]
MKKLFFVLLLLLFNPCHAVDLRQIATWNMKWLGVYDGSGVDAIENVKSYTGAIQTSGATLWAIQEIGPTHSVNGKTRCYYLDKIIEDLNHGSGTSSWSYILDEKNKRQRLGFLYRADIWAVRNPRSIKPGPSFNYIRTPFLVDVVALGHGKHEPFTLMNLHLKAFPDKKSATQRAKNIEQLTQWLNRSSNNIPMLITGDTNLYSKDVGFQAPLRKAGYVPIKDPHPTAAHRGQLTERFDRFYYSSTFQPIIKTTLKSVSNDAFIKVTSEDKCKILFEEHFVSADLLEQYCLVRFVTNVSDHLPVTLTLDFDAMKVPYKAAM